MSLRNWLSMAALGGLAACQTPAPPEYMVSRDTLFFLQQLPAVQTSVGEFTAGDGSGMGVPIPGSLLTCSGDFEDSRTGDAGAYVRRALVQELTAAGLYNEDDPAVRIDGTVERISLTRKIPFTAEWTIGLRLRSSNGAELEVLEEYRFDAGSLVGATVCERAIEHFEPAVRALLETAVRTDGFDALLVAS